MILPILLYPDPILLRQTVSVTKFDRELLDFCTDMIITMDHHQAVGLAANQTGDPRRICVSRHASYQEGLSQIWINPQIVAISGEQLGPEGCLSFPGMIHMVRRYGTVTIMYQDHVGNDQRAVLAASKTFMSVIMQHEIQHLDGKIFIDPLSI